jgi:hypothetical protein
MLRRLSLGLVGLSLVAAVAACNSDTSTPGGGLGIGPNFPSLTLYAANTTQNAVGIFPPKTASGSGPAYQIAGSNTTLSGPQYLSFDSSDNLWVSNYNVSAGTSSVVEIKALATGNVIPFGGFTYANMGQVRGIAVDNNLSEIALAAVDPTATNPASPSQIQLFDAASTGGSTPFSVITGNLTGLNVPSGVAFDKVDSIYVTNLQGASVEKFTVPTPSPTPTGTATPTPTASPTPTPTPVPTATPVGPTPTPAPTATPAYFTNLAPSATIAGASTLLINPTGIALDTAGNIYVSDSGRKAVLVFGPTANGNVAPLQNISGSNTGFVSPTDVKVDTAGLIYVADGGAGKIFIFAAGATGNVAPTTTYTAPGTLVGIGLAP